MPYVHLNLLPALPNAPPFQKVARLRAEGADERIAIGGTAGSEPFGLQTPICAPIMSQTASKVIKVPNGHILCSEVRRFTGGWAEFDVG